MPGYGSTDIRTNHKYVTNYNTLIRQIRQI